jgi:DNA-binding HxlR family transcriptional regulator
MRNNVSMNDCGECAEHAHNETSAFCPRYRRAIELVGRRWTGAVLRVLLGGPTRFSDITGLELEGIVQRSVFPETPVRIEYALTEKGRALEEVITAVATWAETWIDQPAPEDADAALHLEAAVR